MRSWPCDQQSENPLQHFQRALFPGSCPFRRFDIFEFELPERSESAYDICQIAMRDVRKGLRPFLHEVSESLKG